MRYHEYYFHAFEGGAQALDSESALRAKIEKDFGNFDSWMTRFKAIAMTRGIGWAILYYDSQTDTLLNAWVDEQHLGHLTGLTPIIALDMWEHSYLMDYIPSEKKNYIEAFFKNLNWNTIEKNFTK
jgi:Fe-Mn family superoxide dismutase